MLANFNLRQKISLLFLLAVVLPTLLITWLFTTIYQTRLYPEYRTQVETSADQLASSIDYRLKSYEIFLSRISADVELQDRLTQVYNTQQEIWESTRYFTRAYETVGEFLPGISQFRIYYENPSLPEDGGILWHPRQRLQNGEAEKIWYDRLLFQNEPLNWQFTPSSSDRTRSFLLSRKILAVSGSEIGLLSAHIDCQQLFGDFVLQARKDHRVLIILDQDNLISYGTETNLLGQRMDIAFVKTQIKSSKGISVSRTLKNNFKILEFFPQWALDSKTWAIIWWALGLALLLIIFDGFLLFLIVRNLQQRLLVVSNHMKALSSGDFVSLAHEDQNDELSVIESGFNQMSERLKVLLDELIKSRLQEREESFKALQAQINPHFLYNSLGVLRWMALDGQTQELCTAIDSLARFYRLSLKDEAGFIPISDELEQVKAYLEIQQLRYKHCVHIKYSIEDGVEKLYTLKLMLQPLVENCYKHGRVAKNGKGVIEINIKKTKSKVNFVISDNGIGMEAEILEALQAGVPSSQEEGGYGLRNIQDRLKVCFKNEASLDLSSTLGEGTSISIQIPICEQAPEIRI